MRFKPVLIGILLVLVALGIYFFQNSDNSSEDATFQRDANGFSYHGKVTVTGYARTEEMKEGFCEENCKTYSYAFFHILDADTSALFNFLEENAGNSFVGESEVGLGCVENGVISYFNSFDDESARGSSMNEYTLNLDISKVILESTKENPVTITLEKLPLSAGSGAPDCYSHFTIPNFTISNNITIINITYPSHGQAVDSAEVTVKGEVNESITGIEVNGEVNGYEGEINAGKFMVAHIHLSLGENTLRATAYDSEGNRWQQSITVYTKDMPPYVRLNVTPVNGSPPLNVNFTLTPLFSTPIVSFDIDYDGDGIVDETHGNPDRIKRLYEHEGLFEPSVTVRDVDGKIYHASSVLNLYAVPNLVPLWDAMTERLVQGDIDDALEYFSENTRDRYRQMFTAMDNNLANTFSSLPALEFLSLENSEARYSIERTATIGGKNVVLKTKVIFRKDSHGQWKIEAI